MGSLPGSTHGTGAKAEKAAQSSAQAAPTSSLPSSAPASAKPKGFKIKLGRGASAGIHILPFPFPKHDGQLLKP